MREILFKAKVLYNGNHLFAGQGVEGSLIIRLNGVFIYVIEKDEFDNIIRMFEVEVDPETVCQYTGLIDKNGVKIFEGDLLRTPPNNKWEELNYSCFEVFFHGGNANSDYNIGYSISRMHNYGAVCGGYIPSFKPKTMSNMIVIGNIHDKETSEIPI